MEIKCEKCGKMKYVQAFNFKDISKFELDTSECLDCKDPNRWKDVKESIFKQMKKDCQRRRKSYDEILDESAIEFFSSEEWKDKIENIDKLIDKLIK